MNNILRMTAISALAAMTVSCGSGSQAQQDKDFRYLVDEFADLKIMRYRIPGWEELSLQQKEYAYHLGEAAKYGRDILWDQHCSYNLPIRKALETFTGEQDQVAPLFSAKSVDGVRAYEMARRLYREGRKAEAEGVIRASRINIYGLELLSYSEGRPLSEFVPEFEGRDRKINVAGVEGLSLPTAMIRVDCSKGTYIRALARDLGESLGSGAFLSSLRRTRNGGFGIEEALSLDEALALFGG